MTVKDIISSALINTGRAKLRTFLTVLAIFIGAFTLTITSGIGAGVNNYVSRLVDSVGQEDQLFISIPQNPFVTSGTITPGSGEGPAKYEPESQQASDQYGTKLLTPENIETIESIEHVTSVNPIYMIQAEYLEVPDGEQYNIARLGFPTDLASAEFVAGEAPDHDAAQLTVPADWVGAFGYAEGEESQMLDETIEIGVINQVGEMRTVEATVSGVTDPIVSGVGSNPTPSQELYEQLFLAQGSGYGVDPEPRYVQAVATVDDMEAHGADVKAELQDHDLVGATLEDQLGVLNGIVTAITFVFNGFAFIALLAASFGIVNTLLMSVQERTREVGLMKALGMTNRKVFALFSTEAVVIGVMGSVLGIVLGLGVGTVVNTALVNGPLSDVAGLSLFGIDPLAILIIFLLIVFIAFLAGTLPARRASKKDPIEALRHE